ncbi:hypothetical protein [Isoptericola dokdonensis]|uniref:Uncharacterized protein n=1 Tax=Isoptericola dokdonensis DS-3 TaxID=1300344 RepID=A0A161IFS3_9MICO|nr:hypothetical protein [Isoptericola dokdonensis]ANC32377.1 hypothetical protein I598_2858 [Isoptericola dokdonensis DS-3]
MRRTSRLVTVLLAALSLVLVGLVPAEAAPPRGTGTFTLKQVDLDVTVSMADVVVGPSPKVARMWFTFDHPRERLSLDGSGKSVVSVDGPGISSLGIAYLVKTSERRAYADFVLSAGDRPGTYAATVELRTTVDGQDYVFFRENAVSFQVRRATQASASAKRSGGKAVVTGRLTRWQDVEHRTAIARRPVAGAAVRLSFDPKGKAGARYVTTVRTDGDGRFRKVLRDRGKGRWVASYRGSAQQAPSWARPTGAKEPAVDHWFSRSRTTDGTRVTMKVRTRDVVVKGASTKTRVDVEWSASGPGRLEHGTTYVCASSRIGRYEGGCSTVRKDGPNKVYAHLYLGPDEPAGVYDVEVWADPEVRTTSGTSFTYFPTARAGSFRVSKATRTNVRVSDTSVRQGERVVVSGRLRMPSQLDRWNYGGWRGAAGEKVKIYFDPKGSRGPVLKGSDTVGADGRFRQTFAVRKSGTWVVRYAGSSVAHLRPSSAKVSVVVR